MLHTFANFLSENQIENNTPSVASTGVTKRFSIIAAYGKWSCVALLAALLMNISMSVVGRYNPYANLLQACCHAMMHVSFLLLLLMKVALKVCDTKEEQADCAARNPLTATSGIKSETVPEALRDVRLTVATNRDVKSVSTLRRSEGNALNISRTAEAKMRNISSYDMVALSTHGILTVSGVLELAYLFYFLAVIERQVTVEKPTVFSRFNMTIVSLSLSLISLHAATAVNVYERPFLFECPIARTIAGLGIAIYELMYIWYTWLRSKVILKLKGKKTSLHSRYLILSITRYIAGGFRYSVAAAVVTIAPGITAIQFAALCFHLYLSDEFKPTAALASNITTAVSGLAIIAFDCIMLHTFANFLSENQIENNTPSVASTGVTKRFSIIAAYGKWSCVALLAALLMNISMSVVGRYNPYANLLQACCHAMMHVSFLLLLLMKVALKVCDTKEEQADCAARNPLTATSGIKSETVPEALRDVRLTVATNRDVKSVSTLRRSEGNALNISRTARQ
ncbi:hypothetical protein HDU78_004021 [Chytriomyces hyalinus]|nr:hypothetical protein HDU78_004021 [Chytriomyces hyalinus]